MVITNLQSPRSGRPVPNQYCLMTTEGKRYFQSYCSLIAYIEPNGEIYLAKDAYLSRTTKKYLKVFLDRTWMTAEEFNKFINNLKTF